VCFVLIPETRQQGREPAHAKPELPQDPIGGVPHTAMPSRKLEVTKAQVLKRTLNCFPAM
jgi:hypothetical protein